MVSLKSTLLSQLFPQITSMEAAPPTGKPQIEREHVFYGRLVDPDELEKADSREHQEQWSLYINQDGVGYDGTIRIRVVDQRQYILTMKTSVKKSYDKIETEYELPPKLGAVLLDQFKRLSPRGLSKTRYCFRVPASDLVWEVDVFEGPNGKPAEWVKLDLEVKDRQAEIPPFPIRLRGTCTLDPANNKDDEARATQLYERDWAVASPYAT